MELCEQNVDFMWNKFVHNLNATCAKYESNTVIELQKLIERNTRFEDIIMYISSKFQNNEIPSSHLKALAYFVSHASPDWMNQVVFQDALGFLCISKRITEFIECVIALAVVPGFDGREDHSYNATDFTDVADKAKYVMEFINMVISVLLSKIRTSPAEDIKMVDENQELCTNTETIPGVGKTVSEKSDALAIHIQEEIFSRKTMTEEYSFSDAFCQKVKVSKGTEDDKESEMHSTSLNCTKTKMNAFLKRICAKLLLLCISHQEENLWSSTGSINAANTVMSTLCSIYKAESIGTLLIGSHPHDQFPSGCIKDIIFNIKTKLTRENWTKYPGMWCVYKWCLFSFKFPHLSEYLEYFLPPALLFVDDYKTESKIAGVKCLHHIIQNVSPTELKRYGHADVVYNALQHQFYTQEPELLRVLFPSLISILALLESSPRNLSNTAHDRHDDIFQRFLRSMEIEDKILLRHLYAEQFAVFLEVMGIATLKFYKRTLNVVYAYLEVYDGPHEISRIGVLKCLQIIIKKTWIRIPKHCDNILKSLLKLTYDISVQEGLTSQSAKDELLTETVKCLILLKQASEEKVSAELQKLAELDEMNDYCRQCMIQVLNM